MRGRKGFLKSLTGVIAGVVGESVGTEIYERLYYLPALERSFRAEIT